MAGTNIGTAWVSIKPSLEGVQSKIQNELRKAFDGFGDTIKSGTAIGTALGNAIYDGAKTAVSKIASLAKETLSSATTQMDSVIRTSNALQQMGYDSNKVSKYLEQLKKNAKVTAASFGDLSEGFMALTASWKDMDLTADATQALSDAILSFGGTPDQVANAITQISQVDVDGPLDAQTWLSLRNSGLIPVLGTLADMNGMSLGEFKSALGQGALTTRDLVNGLIELDKQGTETQESLYQIARSNAAKTWSGAWETARNAVVQSLSDQTQSLWETSGAGEKIIDMGERIADSIGPALERAKEFAIYLKDNLGPAFERLARNAKPVIEYIVNLSKEFKNAIIDKLVTFLRDVADAISNILESKDVIKFFKDSAKFALGLGKAIATIVTKAVVTFLNAIGTALKFILEHKPVLAFIESLAVAIGVWTLAVKANAAAIALWKVANSDLIPQLTIAKASMDLMTASGGTLSQALMTASANTTGLTSAVTGLAGNLAAAVLPVTILVGVVTALYTAFEFTKTVTMDTTLAKQNYQKAVEYVNQASERESTNIQRVIDDMNALKDAQDALTQATNNVASTEQQRRDALSNLDEVAKTHGTTVEDLQGKYLNYSGDVKALSDEELALYTAVQNYANAEVRANQAIEEQAKALQKTNEQYDAQHESASIAYQDQILAEVGALKASDGYEAAANKLKEYANAESGFIDINGERMEFTAEEMAWISKGVSDSLAASDKVWKETWDNMGVNATSSAKDIKNAFNKLPGQLSSIGTNAASQMSSGFTSGNNAQLNKYYSAGASAAQQIKNGFNNILEIHSPSRVMMRSGRFVAEGVIDGLSAMDSDLVKTSTTLAEDMVGAFNGYRFDTPSLTADGRSVMSTVSGQSNARVVQNNVFNVADSFDLQQVSSDLGYAVAMA